MKILSSLLEKVIAGDRQLFQFLNSCHADILDQPFFLISSDWFWIPLYILFIYLIINRLKSKSYLAIGLIVVAVALSDQGANLLKKKTHRFRPTHDPVLSGTVHKVNGYEGGTYGFVSSHAANTFCVAVLISNFLSLSPFFATLLFIWATIVSYSRIYLGVHFPLDVVCGALLGFFIGSLMKELWKKYKKQFDQKPVLPKY